MSSNEVQLSLVFPQERDVSHEGGSKNNEPNVIHTTSDNAADDLTDESEKPSGLTLEVSPDIDDEGIIEQARSAFAKALGMVESSVISSDAGSTLYNNFVVANAIGFFGNEHFVFEQVDDHTVRLVPHKETIREETGYRPSRRMPKLRARSNRQTRPKRHH